jgi:UDP-N-acetylglucosamine 4,6-dehydratase/5-epimerase
MCDLNVKSCLLFIYQYLIHVYDERTMFGKKTLLITGGTGSFGNAVARRFAQSDIGQIRIFSRDEKKQDDMRKRYDNPKIKFYLGDVRDRNSVRDAMRGVDYVFHAAALKQVPSCEFYPMQAVQTNILGTENVLTEAIDAQVKRVVCLSTDKAVYPINAMGISKALMEKVMVATSRNLRETDTIICGTRYGNVMASRGSVIPLFINQVWEGRPITITDPTMTRFMMTLADAVDLVLYAFEKGLNGDIFVQKAPAATVQVLTHAILKIMKQPEHPVHIMGARHGEKLYESLLSREEMAQAKDLGRYYCVSADQRDLNYANYTEFGDPAITEALHIEEYSSHNTEQLSADAMESLLMKLEFMQRIAVGERATPEE